MYTQLLKIFCISAFLFSCTPPKEEDEKIPETLLTDEQLINVLSDFYLAEGASGINVKNVTGDKYDSAYVFNPLKDNGIKKSKFDSTMTYYTHHPKKLKLIYEKVLEKLTVYQVKGKLK